MPLDLDAIVQDIKDGIKEVRADVGGLRKDLHDIAVKVASLGDTHHKIDQIDDRVDRLFDRMERMDDRIAKAEQKLAVANHEAAKVHELQQTTWTSTGKGAGILAALAAGAAALGGWFSKLLGE